MTNLPKKEPTIVDITVREGGYLVHHHLLAEQVTGIAKELEHSGMEIMEVSHGRGVGAKKAGYPALLSDKELLKSARRAAPKLKYSVFLSTYSYSLFEWDKIAEYCDLARVGLHLDEVANAQGILPRIKEAKKKAVAMLQRAHRSPASEIAEGAKQLAEAGYDVVYLCDTFGSMGADDVKNYLGQIRAKVQIPIGFQSHNNTGRAMDNSLTALEEGAEWLDAALLGLGPNGGVTPLEVLVSVLQKKGLCSKINLKDLCIAANWYALPAVRKLPQTRYLDLLFSKHKIDYYPSEILEVLADILEVDLEAFLLELIQQRPSLIRLKEQDLKDYLQTHKLDWDVVLGYIKTGKIPLAEFST